MSDESTTPWCSCGSRCATHGVISLDDRNAAWEAGYARGVIDGRLGQIENDLDALALRQASDLIQFVVTRTIALVTGPNWAAEVAGPKPVVTVRDSGARR